MQITARIIILISALLLLSCTKTPKYKTQDFVYAYSTLPALANSVYDGQLTVGDLKKQGNSGLGTFNGLNGEMVVLDGIVHQVLESGEIRHPLDDELVPFCTISFFKADTTININTSTSYDDLKLLLFNQFRSYNYPITFQIHGLFDEILCGGAPKQEHPYTNTLAEAIKNRPNYKASQIDGSLVGIWIPQFMTGLNLTGFHLHFIADNEKFGGHLLSFSSKQLSVEMDYKMGYISEFPNTYDYAKKSIDLKNGYNR